MKLYFLRHGQSQANVDGVFAGQGEDSPLTALGIEQAQQAAQGLKDHGITVIISSNLQRAQQTAAEVAEALDINAIRIDARVSEYDMGALTGMPNRKISSQELVAAKNAEDPHAFQERVLSFLREHLDDSETLLVVSHAGVGRVIEASREGLNPALFYDLPSYPNAQAIELDLSWLQ